MPANFNSDEISNDNLEIVEEDGNLIYRHIPSGAEFIFDSTANTWVPAQGLDLRGSGLANAQLATDLDANNNSVSNVDTVSAEEASLDLPIVYGSYGFRSGFEGDTLDERLDNALSFASDGDVIHLESDGNDYETDRTIEDRYRFIGDNPGIDSSRTRILGDWTLEDTSAFEWINIGGDFTFENRASSVTHCKIEGSVTFEGTDNILHACRGTGSNDVEVVSGAELLVNTSIDVDTFGDGTIETGTTL